MTAARRQTVPKESAIRNPSTLRPAVAFGLCLLVYLCLFYLTNDKRPQLLVLLFAPDVLINDLVGNDWSRFGPIDHFPVLLGTAVIVAAAWLTGRLALDALALERIFTPLEKFVFGTAIGLNLWSLFTLLIGLFGWLQVRWIFAAAAGLVVAAALVRANIWRSMAKPPEPGPTTELPWLGLKKLAVALAVPFAITIVWGGTLPPTHFDVREYHLQVPKEWYLNGRVTFLPHNVYGNMPLGAEMHSILGMQLATGPLGWWWGSLIGKTVIATMAPLTALGVYTAGRRFFSPATGVIAAFLFISTPWIAHVAMNGLIDGASAYYFLLAVYAALVRFGSKQPPAPSTDKGTGQSESHASGEETPETLDERTDRGLVAVSGFLAGGAVACKYPALLFLVVPLFAVITWFPKRRIQWGAAIVYSLAVAAGCGLWLGKNWAFSGNPTYPLLYSVFGGRSWTPEKDEQWTRVHGVPAHGFQIKQVWGDFLTVVLRSDYLSPALWPFAVAAYFSYRTRDQRWKLGLLLALMLWTTAVWWLMTHRVDRFLVPLLPLMALFAGHGAVAFHGTAWRRLIAGALVVTFAINMVINVIASDNRLLISLRDLRFDEPDPDTPRMTRVHPAHRYLNRHVRAGYQVLLCGEAQVFDFEVPVLYNTCFDDCVFEKLMRGRNRDERLAILREHRISHVYIHWYDLDRYRSPGNYGYSEYTTRELIHRELVGEQGILQRVRLPLDPENGEVFEVVGWRDWK